MTYAICRSLVAFIWIYHGLVPKILFPSQDEATMLLAGGIPPEYLYTARVAIGLAEVALGLVMLFAWKVRSLFSLTIALMMIALVSVAAQAPEYLIEAFNPVTLNLAMIALSVIGLLSGKDLPSARRCKRTKPEIT